VYFFNLMEADDDDNDMIEGWQRTLPSTVLLSIKKNKRGADRERIDRESF
jgi:hypothetical protein